MGNVYRGLDTGEREKLTGSVLMQAQAAVDLWDARTDPMLRPYAGIYSTLDWSCKRDLDDHLVWFSEFVTYGIVGNS